VLAAIRTNCFLDLGVYAKILATIAIVHTNNTPTPDTTITFLTFLFPLTAVSILSRKLQVQVSDLHLQFALYFNTHSRSVLLLMLYVSASPAYVYFPDKYN
jgi:hypothetical protein